MAKDKDTRKKFKLQGITFATSREGQSISLGALVELYLIMRAREGDKLAADILDAGNAIVMDVDGAQIWPMLEKEIT